MRGKSIRVAWASGHETQEKSSATRRLHRAPVLINGSLTVPTLLLVLSQAISLNIHEVTLAQRITDEAVCV